MQRPRLDFWFDFGSTYSYPAALRIQGLAQAAGVEVRYRPFMLGAVFKAQGWETSPFNIYPAKGRYMWRDLERLCHDLGLPLVRPIRFRRTASWRRESPWRGGRALDRRLLHGGVPCGVRRGPADRRDCRYPRHSRGARRGCRSACSEALRSSRSRPGCAAKRRKRSASAFSVRQRSSPRTASCSGATIAWRLPSHGHAAHRILI